MGTTTLARKRFMAGAAALLFLLLSGCASTWVMDLQPTDTRMQWPSQPKKAKAVLLSDIQGFRESGISASSLVYGRGVHKLRRPGSVATGPDGRLAIADTGCNCVHVYLPAEQQYHKVLGTGKEAFLSPVGIAFDNEEKIYIADSALAKIFVFDSQLAFLFSIGQAADGALKRPTGLAFDRNRNVLYAVDTLAHAVHAFDTKGTYLFSFGRRGTEEGQFNFPTHIFWSASGKVYVTDSMNFRVQIFSLEGNFLSAFGSQGDGSGDFAIPKGVAADKDRTVFVVDSLFDTVQLFDADQGEFLLALGRRGTGPGEFWLPSGIFIDDDDKLYVCDTFNERVQVFQLFRSKDQGE